MTLSISSSLFTFHFRRHRQSVKSKSSHSLFALDFCFSWTLNSLVSSLLFQSHAVLVICAVLVLISRIRRTFSLHRSISTNRVLDSEENLRSFLSACKLSKAKDFLFTIPQEHSKSSDESLFPSIMVSLHHIYAISYVPLCKLCTYPLHSSPIAWMHNFFL